MVEREDEILILGELLADEALGLGLVRRHQVRLGRDAEAERLALGVEDRANSAAAQLTDRLRVEVLSHAPRQRAREHHDVRAAGEVEQLLAQQLELLLLHLAGPTR